VCGVGRAGGAVRVISARREEMRSQPVYLQLRRLGGGLRSWVKSTIERAI